MPPIDRALGGVRPGRIVLLTGPTGAGKSAASLRFLDEALRRGETAVLLTQHRVADVRAHAMRIGLDLRAAVRERRLILLRYSTSFGEQLALGASTETVVAAMREAIDSASPARIAIDTIAPLLAGGSRAAARLEALADLLEETGAATLITGGDAQPDGDRTLEPLAQRAAAVLRLVREERGRLRLERVTTRFEPPDDAVVYCSAATGALESVDPGADVVDTRALRGARDVRAIDDAIDVHTPIASAGVLARDRRETSLGPVVILHVHDSADDELRALVAREHHVQAMPASAGDVPRDAAAILVEVSHATLAAATARIRELAVEPGIPPLIAVSRYTLRSLDRAQLVRAGADECVIHESGAAEFFARLDAAIARGHRPDAPRSGVEPAVPSAPAASSTRQGMVDRAAFARALAEHVTRDTPVQYSVVSLATAANETTSLPELAELAYRTMRALSGDLVTVHETAVLVCLLGARRTDTNAFLDRLRERWSVIGRHPLQIESFTYPADEPRLRRLITTGSET